MGFVRGSLIREGALEMRLRDHPKLRWRGSPVWPPPWAGPREPGTTGPIGEQGVLREAQLLGAVPPIPARLALVIEYEGRRFTGVLFVDDADFLVRLHETFRGYLGRPIPEIGSLEVEA